jgi:hypothetical protein
MLLLNLLFACEDKPDTNEPASEPAGEFTWDADSTVCGQIEQDSEDCGGYPDSVTVWNIAPETTACSERGWDTGSEWVDWRESEAAVLTVDSEGRFQGVLDAGEYGFTATSEDYCFGCQSEEVSGENCTMISLTIEENVSVDAPNIYLYPLEPTAVHVQVANPERITISDPVYPRGGWWAVAEPDGQLLTKEGWKDYLFYETLMPPKAFQRNEGWCVPGEQAQFSIEDSMADYGFLANEIIDFSDFWDSEFPQSKWMTVYPQVNDLLPVGISPSPDSFLRVWYLIEDGCKAVTPLEFEAPKRIGFHAAEWGVIISGGLKGPEVVMGLLP